MSEQEKFTAETEVVNLADVDFSSLLSEIEQYNGKFSAGHLMAKIVTGAGVREKEWDQQQQLSLIKTKNQFEPVLQQTGLSLESVNAGATLFSAEAKFATGEIRMNIADREKFINYLQALDPETITEQQLNSITAILTGLTKQLQGQYQIDNPNDERMIELLAGLDRIVTEGKRLDPNNTTGLNEVMGILSKYQEALQGHYIKEFLTVERAGLLLEIGGSNFGPSKWHTDATPDFYEKKWESALAILKTLKGSKGATELFAKVKDNLEKSAKYAMSEMAEKLKVKANQKYYGPLMHIADEYYDKITSV